VDFSKKVWLLPQTKTDQPMLIPLTDLAAQAFEGLRALAHGSAWVLPAKKTASHLKPAALGASLQYARGRFRDAGVAPFTLHDLRRTCRTGLGRLGVARDIAELVINHRPRGIVATYDIHAYLDEKRAALERWSAHLMSLATKI